MYVYNTDTHTITGYILHMLYSLSSVTQTAEILIIQSEHMKIVNSYGIKRHGEVQEAWNTQEFKQILTNEWQPGNQIKLEG